MKTTLQEDLLLSSILQLYFTLKNKINKTSEKEKPEKEEEARLVRLGSLVLFDYVKSMVDIFLSHPQMDHEN